MDYEPKKPITMRKLLILRGVPGSGKSTALHALGMGENRLALDDIRLLLGGPEMLTDGRVIVPQSHNNTANSLFVEMAAARMERGETLALDATFAEGGMEPFLKLAREHGYQVACLDFSAMPPDRVRDQNRRRTESRRLTEAQMDTFFTQIKTRGLPEGLRKIAWRTDGGHLDEAQAWLAPCHKDLSHYENIVFVGDTQGCLSVLIGPGGPMEHGLQPDTHYVFVGDLLDRGPENGALLRWFLDHAMGEHVSLIYGNHERHLHRWSEGLPAVSDEFEQRTLPQLLEAGITREDAAAVIAKSVEAMTLEWRGQNILVTHAGLPRVPERLGLVSSKQLTHGTGVWNDPIDAQFERHGQPDWVQVHGHRNHGAVDVVAHPRSINLEDQVDRGGCLRWARLNVHGWQGYAVENTHYLPWRGRLKGKRKSWAPAWMAGEENKHLSEATLQAMREHPGVVERVSNSLPHVGSLNFTREVFHSQTWDAVTLKARGLFFDLQTQHILARGYPKFFHLDERDETRLEGLGERWSFPVTAYVKENGFLGNLGYDERRRTLLLTSKSTPDGPFAEMFSEMWKQKPLKTQEGFKHFLRDMEACAVFEVIDPLRDPHLIDYPQPQLVLLDVFRRSETGERVEYDDLLNLGHKFGLEVKRRAVQLPHEAALRGWLGKMRGRMDWRWHGEDVEGFVLEDRDGRMAKIKTARYAFWKQMRSTSDRIRRLRHKKAALLESTGRPQGQAMAGIEDQMASTVTRDSHPMAMAFTRWCVELPLEVLDGSSLLALRSAFQKTPLYLPEWERVPWMATVGSKPGGGRGEVVATETARANTP